MAPISEREGDDMLKLQCFPLLLSYLVLLVFPARVAGAVSIEGAPADTGFNVGSTAVIRAAVKGLAGDAGGFTAFADIQYAGGASVTSVEMDHRAGGSLSGEIHYEADWPIPADAPTGLYTVAVRVEDRSTRKTVATHRLRGFVAYRKLVRITRFKLDKTFYSVGDPIQCEVVLENLTDQPMKGLRVEFSNANYPWISLFSAGKETENPELALRVLKDGLSISPESEAVIPMMSAGTAAILQGTQVAVLGAGGPARHEKVPPPEVDQYTLAVWNAERTVLYDMQFSPQAIVRPPDRDLPKPYSHNFTHPYNSDIDFAKYREFYSPGEISPAIRVDHSRTLYRRGDRVRVKATLKNPGEEAWRGLEVQLEISGADHQRVHAATLGAKFDLAAGGSHDVEADGWEVPNSAAGGAYQLKLSLVSQDGKRVAATATEIAVNDLPDSLIVFAPHEDDEHAYAGLIRAALEASVPVRVVVFTGGDVGACERYYSKPCGPNEAREFGLVRMEETAETLEHIGLARDKLTFLGLPDGGSGAIWSQHIRSSDPFFSIYLATDRAPYENVLKPNLPFARDAVIDAVKQIITGFRPALIATPHPDERHVDHRTANWFVVKACQELLREGRMDPRTVILADQAYGAGGFKPAPYRYEKATVYLTGEAAALKQEMGWIYQSQDGNLAEGMRQAFAELPREEVHYRILDWQEHAGWNE